MPARHAQELAVGQTEAALLLFVHMRVAQQSPTLCW